VAQEALSIWEMVWIVVGFIRLDDWKVKLLGLLWFVTAMIPIVQFTGLTSDFRRKGQLGPLEEICEATNPLDAFLDPRWLGLEFIPNALILPSCLVMLYLASKIVVTNQPKIYLG
jgi:hypothetical protein